MQIVFLDIFFMAQLVEKGLKYRKEKAACEQHSILFWIVTK